MISTIKETSPYPEVQWSAILVSKSGSCFQEYINALPIMGHGATEGDAKMAVKSQVCDLIVELTKLINAH